MWEFPKKFIPIIFCSIILFNIGNYGYNPSETKAKTEQPFLQEINTPPLAYSAGYENSGPIEITSDEDWGAFPGSGTAQDPYRIEWLWFELTERLPAISINGTTKHFLISHCYFETDFKGIFLYAIANNTATIANNIFNGNNANGIVIIHSNFVRVENNTGRLDHVGIRVSYSIGTVLVNNSFYGGISLDYLTASGTGFTYCQNATIINNTFNFFNRGIYAKNCSGFLIADNTVLNTREYGSIYLTWSNEMIVKNNYIYNNLYSDGIRLYSTDNSMICYNTIIACADYGVALMAGAMNNTVHHNNFLYNYGYGSQALDSQWLRNNIWFDNNTKEGNFWSDWGGEGNYSINGWALTVDPYPLATMVNLTMDDIILPNNETDDLLEENDYKRNAVRITTEKTYNLIAADVDLYLINLSAGKNYTININTETTSGLECYLIDSGFMLGLFDVLAGGKAKEGKLQYTFEIKKDGDYYLLVFNDLEHYKTAVPAPYSLEIISQKEVTTSLGGAIWTVITGAGITLCLCFRKKKT